MVLVISQETFDSAVRENIEDLGLSPEEAVKEAVAQFKCQGVDLSNIVKEFMSSSSNSDSIKDTVQQLSNLCKSQAPPEKILEQLEVIKTECDKSLQYKVEFGKSGAYDVILDILSKYQNNVNIKKICFKSLISLMSKQPDLLNDRGVQVIISYLDKDVDADLKKYTLKWTKECCIMHEMNRQKIFDAHILDQLKIMLNDGSSDLLKEVLAVFRALLLDDDVRVEFGKAHEHARIIANETLCTLTDFLGRFQHDEQLIHDLMLTLSTLLVRTEFCKKVEDAGGLEKIKDAMLSYGSSEKVPKQCFKLIKALAGNDDCKIHIIQKNIAPVIIETLNANKGNVSTVSAGLSCVAALTLRSPENSKAFFEAGISPVIVDILRTHPNEKSIQKMASWAIRNMVSRSKYQCKTFLDLGVEELLQNSLKKFKDIEYDIKAALRDLGCHVQLKEEWTGKGGALTTNLPLKS